MHQQNPSLSSMEANELTSSIVNANWRPPLTSFVSLRKCARHHDWPRRRTCYHGLPPPERLKPARRANDGGRAGQPCPLSAASSPPRETSCDAAIRRRCVFLAVPSVWYLPALGRLATQPAHTITKAKSDVIISVDHSSAHPQTGACPRQDTSATNPTQPTARCFGRPLSCLRLRLWRVCLLCVAS